MCVAQIPFRLLRISTYEALLHTSNEILIKIKGTVEMFHYCN